LIKLAGTNSFSINYGNNIIPAFVAILTTETPINHPPLIWHSIPFYFLLSTLAFSHA